MDIYDRIVPKKLWVGLSLALLFPTPDVSSQTSMIPVTDTYPLVGDNGIDLCVSWPRCVRQPRRLPKLSSQFWQVLFDNLRRLAGVSGAGARRRNPDPKRSRRGRILEFEATSSREPHREPAS